MMVSTCLVTIIVRMSKATTSERILHANRPTSLSFAIVNIAETILFLAQCANISKISVPNYILFTRLIYTTRDISLSRILQIMILYSLYTCHCTFHFVTIFFSGSFERERERKIYFQLNVNATSYTSTCTIYDV